MSGVVNCASYEAGRRVSDVDLAHACPAETEGGFVWIGLHEPDKALLREVQQRFGLHDLAIEDALVAHQRPKLELYGGGVFIALRTAQLVDRKFQFGETHIFAGRGYVVTVRHGSTTPTARCARAAKRAEDARDGRELRRLFDHGLRRRPLLSDRARPRSRSRRAGGGDLRQKTGQSDVERIYELRHELLLLRRAVQPLQEVCNRIMRFDVSLIDNA